MSVHLQNISAPKKMRHRRTQSSSTNELKEWTSEFLKKKGQKNDSSDGSSEKKIVFFNCMSSEETKKAIFASVNQTGEKQVIIDKLENEEELLRDNNKMMFLPAFLRNNYVNSVNFNISIQQKVANGEEKRKKYLNLLNLKPIDEEIGQEGNVCSLSPNPTENKSANLEKKKSFLAERKSSISKSFILNKTNESYSSMSNRENSKIESETEKIKLKKKMKRSFKKNPKKPSYMKKKAKANTYFDLRKKKKNVKKKRKIDNSSKPKFKLSSGGRLQNEHQNSKKSKKKIAQKSFTLSSKNATPSHQSTKTVTYLQKIQNYSKTSRTNNSKLKKFSSKFITDLKDIYTNTPKKATAVCLSTTNIRSKKLSKFTKSARYHRRTHSEVNSISQMQNFYKKKPSKNSSVNFSKEGFGYLKFGHHHNNKIRKSTGRKSEPLLETSGAYVTLMKNVSELEGKLKDYEFLVNELRKENGNLRRKNMLLEERNKAKKKIIDRQNLELQKYEEFVKITEFNFYSLKEQKNLRERINQEETVKEFKKWFEKNKSGTKSDVTEETQETMSMRTPQKNFTLAKAGTLIPE